MGRVQWSRLVARPALRERGYDSLLEQQTDAKGETGGGWEYRLKQLTTQLSLAYYREFEETLPMVGDEHGENPKEIGF